MMHILFWAGGVAMIAFGVLYFDVVELGALNVAGGVAVIVAGVFYRRSVRRDENFAQSLRKENVID